MWPYPVAIRPADLPPQGLAEATLAARMADWESVVVTAQRPLVSRTSAG